MPTHSYTTPGSQYALGRPWTPMVKRLLIINTLIFLVQVVFSRSPLLVLFGLQVPEVFSEFRLWQPATYLFLHGSFWHLAFNMLALWMFGCEVETVLGSRRFLAYYLITGIGAGLCVAGVGGLAGEQSLTIGASGAIFGILMAYGILFADRTITLLIFFVLPVTMKARTMVFLFGVFEFVAGVGNALGHISHLAHLSGLFIGYLFFWWWRPDLAHRLGLGRIFSRLGNRWKDRNSKVRRIDPEEHLDAILEKISRHGMDSLSQHERDILTEASRRRRGWPDEN